MIFYQIFSLYHILTTISQQNEKKKIIFNEQKSWIHIFNFKLHLILNLNIQTLSTQLQQYRKLYSNNCIWKWKSSHLYLCPDQRHVFNLELSSRNIVEFTFKLFTDLRRKILTIVLRDVGKCMLLKKIGLVNPIYVSIYIYYLQV